MKITIPFLLFAAGSVLAQNIFHPDIEDIPKSFDRLGDLAASAADRGGDRDPCSAYNKVVHGHGNENSPTKFVPYRELHDDLFENELLGCYMEPSCHWFEGYEPRDGYKVVGSDVHVCQPGMGRAIACDIRTVAGFPEGSKCQWRGAPGDCNGAGEPGEVVLFKSGRGGWPSEVNGDHETEQCKTGYKYFTCPLPGFGERMDHCRWETDCSQPACRKDEVWLATGRFVNGTDCRRGLWNRNAWPKFCCKATGPRTDKFEPRPTVFSQCYWADLQRPEKGFFNKNNCQTAPTWNEGHCDLNMCAPDEVTIARDEFGDRIQSHKEVDFFELDMAKCKWNRKKSLCCKPTPEENTPKSLDLS